MTGSLQSTIRLQLNSLKEKCKKLENDIKDKDSEISKLKD